MRIRQPGQHLALPRQRHRLCADELARAQPSRRRINIRHGIRNPAQRQDPVSRHQPRPIRHAISGAGRSQDSRREIAAQRPSVEYRHNRTNPVHIKRRRHILWHRAVASQNRGRPRSMVGDPDKGQTGLRHGLHLRRLLPAAPHAGGHVGGRRQNQGLFRRGRTSPRRQRRTMVDRPLAKRRLSPETRQRFHKIHHRKTIHVGPRAAVGQRQCGDAPFRRDCGVDSRQYLSIRPRLGHIRPRRQHQPPARPHVHIPNLHLSRRQRGMGGVVPRSKRALRQSRRVGHAIARLSHLPPPRKKFHSRLRTAQLRDTQQNTRAVPRRILRSFHQPSPRHRKLRHASPPFTPTRTHSSMPA